MDKDIKDIIIAAISAGGIGSVIALVKSKSNKSKETKKRIKLEFHPIFMQMEEIEHFFENSFSLPDLGRTLLVREMVVNKMRVWKDELGTLAMNMDNCINACKREGEDCNALENLCAASMLRGLDSYTGWYLKPRVYDIKGEMRYDTDSVETMDFFAAEFKRWHSPREDMVRIASHDIAKSTTLYKDCYTRCWDILSIYMYAFIEMKLDAERTIKSLNGTLTGKRFLDVTIDKEKMKEGEENGL